MRDLIWSNDPNGHGNQLNVNILLSNKLIHIEVNNFINLTLGFGPSLVTIAKIY